VAPQVLTYITRRFGIKSPFGVGFFVHSTEFSIITLTKDHVIFTAVNYHKIYNGMNNGYYISTAKIDEFNHKDYIAIV